MFHKIVKLGTVLWNVNKLTDKSMQSYKTNTLAYKIFSYAT